MFLFKEHYSVMPYFGTRTILL